jgi:D-glycero-D-manno-heptose 1,7-bisphosphate phosphatase
MTTAFLDRDGVINESPEVGAYISATRDFRFLPGALEAIALLNEAGVRVIVVTNQRGVALGVLSLEQLEAIHQHMLEEVRSAGARVDAIYFCPHAEDSCDCRKPRTGLYLRARSDFPDIAFDDVFVIGDSDRDMEAGRRLGARLIRIGRPASPDEHGAVSLLDAVKRYFIRGDGK